MPNASSRSVSVVQSTSPSLNGLALSVFPAEIADPVDNNIPFSKGKDELERSK